MNEVLLDTDTLSYFLKGDKAVSKQIQNYLIYFNTLNISIITQYEILSGLHYRDANKQLAQFLALLPLLNVISLDDKIIEIAALKYAETRREGTPVDDIDLLIGATALASNLSIVTHNTKHFAKISHLNIIDWKAN